MSLITIIVPCYNEEEALPIFYDEFNKVANEMSGEKFELLLVNDGSKDNTLSVMKCFAAKDERIKYISFSRNFGKEAAIFAGLKNSTGDYVALMDADLQDPPSLLPEMFKAITEEGYDSVATRRATRSGEPKVRSFFAGKFYKIMSKVSDTEMVNGARDYRLMTRNFVNALLKMSEKNRFTKGMFGWIGFRTKWIEFENVERSAGKTKWSFWKLFSYALDGIVEFSSFPLTFGAIVGIIFMVFGFLGAIATAICRLCDLNASVLLYFACLAVFLCGITVFYMGVLGKYISHIYTETKSRPIYIVGETNIDKENKQDI